jgi:hypothetical protein
VAGTTPTLTVEHEESADRVRWVAPEPTPEINSVNLSASAVELHPASTDVVPATGFGRLKISLGGGSPKARVTIWATGHDAVRA